MTVRRALPEDARAIRDMNEEFNGIGDVTPESIAKRLCDGGEEIVLVALEGDKYAGFACGHIFSSVCYTEPCAEVTEMYVREAFRRRGAAKTMLRELLRLFSELGASEIRVLTGEDNTIARALYESAGFRPSGEIHLTIPVP